jgi:excisionase family DNA binding protein
MKQNTENPSNTLIENRLLRLQEVAQYLNISISFSYRLAETGQLPCVRLGRSCRVRPEDLETYINKNIHSKEDNF